MRSLSVKTGNLQNQTGMETYPDGLHILLWQVPAQSIRTDAGAYVV